jgi:hypothetical protein
MRKQLRRREEAQGPRAVNAVVKTHGGAEREMASFRRAVLWSAVAFLAIAVAGLLLAPGLQFLWIMLLVIAVTAVPQAFLRER